jgi:glycerate kinase
VGFTDVVNGADLVITGEGSLDEQTLAGKAPLGVARAARRARVPVVAVAGRCALAAEQLAVAGIHRAYPLSDLEPDPVCSMSQAAALLERIGRTIARDLAPSWPRSRATHR